LGGLLFGAEKNKMRFLFALVGAVLALIVFFVLTMVSFSVFGHNVFTSIFGQSGLEFPVVVFIGIVCGWLLGSRIQDQKEQAQINRELDEDRIKHEKASTKSPSVKEDL
jgi:hypothetical protein